MRLKLLILSSALAAILAAPAPAAADWIVTPFLGASFGSDVPDFEADVDDTVGDKFTYGGSLAYMGANIIGFELDFGYTPEFFAVTGSGSPAANIDSNVTTVMANVILGAPIGVGPGVRPYGSGGVGIVRSRLSEEDFFDVTNNDLGFNVGGGIMGFFTENVGIRGDIRYFRALVDDEPDNEFDISVGDFNFWRGTVGVSFRF